MGKKIKVVIDTNVIVSAFGWGGNPEKIIDLIEREKIQNFTSMDILAELIRVVGYPKFRFSKTLQADIVETIFGISRVISTARSIEIIKNDPADNRVLECAVACGADFIITGDGHLLDLGSFSGIKILKPDDFLKTMKCRQ